MKAPLTLSFILSLFSSNIYSQTLDEETGFVYVKAEYLLETGRHEDAVTNYNIVISHDPGYKNALIHRGQAKFALGAFKGAKSDAIMSIEVKGIMPESAALLGRAFFAMSERNPAINSLTAAINLDAKNPQYLLWRASVYESSGLKLKACQDYESAMKLGSAEAEVKAINFCGMANTKSNTPPNTNRQGSESGVEDTSTSNSQQAETVSESTMSSNADSTTVNIQQPSNHSKGDTTIIDDSDPMINENIPKEDDTVNSFVIDDDLTINISGQELGYRKIKEIPSILILSDENGKVCINICVNKEGVVTRAEFNSSMSTIVQKSLVSLALRKAKEFEFLQGKYEMQCGIMIFDIKGS